MLTLRWVGRITQHGQHPGSLIYEVLSLGWYLCFEQRGKQSIGGGIGNGKDASTTCWQVEADIGKSSYNVFVGIEAQVKICRAIVVSTVSKSSSDQQSMR